MLSALPLIVAFLLIAPPERTLLVDPVEAARGRETPGKPDITAERDGIAYRFATLENRAEFEREPGRYEAADGGACGRMGPLAGLGDARRYAVHDGRVYFFASDGCRTGFLKEPAKHIEADEPPPTGTEEQRAKGRRALDRALEWAGGSERWKGLSTLRAKSASEQKSGGTVWKVTREIAVKFPGHWRARETWDDLWYTTTRTPEGAAMASRSGSERIAASRGRAFDRWNARTPAAILKAHADGKELAAAHDGEGSVGGAEVEWVKVGLRGAASRLAVAKSDGRLVALEFRGRDGATTVGESTRTYTAYATVKGITLPTAYTVRFDGKDAPGQGSSWDAFEVDPELGESEFALDAEKP